MKAHIGRTIGKQIWLFSFMSCPHCFDSLQTLQRTTWANTSLDFLVLVKICMIGSSLINRCHWELIMYRFIPNVGFRIFHCSCLSINLWGFWTSDSLIPFSASQYTYLPTNLPKTIKHGHSNFAQSNYNSYCCSMDIQFCNVLKCDDKYIKFTYYSVVLIRSACSRQLLEKCWLLRIPWQSNLPMSHRSKIISKSLLQHKPNC